MKKTRKSACGSITVDQLVLFLGVLLLIAYFALEVLIRITPLFRINADLRVLILLLICIVLYCGGRLALQRTKDKTLLRRLFLLFFFCYLYLILTLTLIDETFGRSGAFFQNDTIVDNLRAHYMRRYVNLLPLRSIYEVYICGFRNGLVNSYYMHLNLVGNVCALMPLSFFLPLFFRSQRKWYVFLTTVSLFVVLIEVMQFAFMVGSCDVDDLILNAGGATLLYFLLRLPSFRRLCKWLVADCYEF